MTVEEYKKQMSDCYNLPVALLTGDSFEEIAERARDLTAYRAQFQDQGQSTTEKKSNRELFAEWLTAQTNGGTYYQETPAEPEPAPVPSYPTVKDGGSPYQGITAPPDPFESFREWFYNKSAYDPNARPGGWHRII